MWTKYKTNANYTHTLTSENNKTEVVKEIRKNMNSKLQHILKKKCKEILPKISQKGSQT